MVTLPASVELDFGYTPVLYGLRGNFRCLVKTNVLAAVFFVVPLIVFSKSRRGKYQERTGA